MDIIIRNGVIQKKESEEIHAIKNEAGLLKKNWEEYINNTPGPYYDPKNCHIHVYRKPQYIKNFIGPQDPNLKKLVSLPFKQNETFCAICHIKFESKFTFLSHKKKLVDDNYYNYKLNQNTKKYTISKYERTYQILEQLFNSYLKLHKQQCIFKINVDFNKFKLRDLFKKYIKLDKNKLSYNLKYNIELELLKEKEINFKFYKIVYKLMYKQIIYPISIHRNLLLWPWELTSYQKLRLKDSEYKNSSIFFTYKKITTNYVLID